MSQFRDEPVETVEEWNAILSDGCCCTMPVCPVPIKECESQTANASVYGFFNVDDEEWTVYGKSIYRVTGTYTETQTASHPAGGTYNTVVGSGSFTHDTIQQYVAEDGIDTANLSLGTCVIKNTVYSTLCEGSGNWDRNTYNGWALSDGVSIVASGTDTITETSYTWTSVGGEPDGEGGTHPACWFRRDYEFTEWEHCHSLTPGFCDGFPTSETTTETTYADDIIGGSWDSTESETIYENPQTWDEWVVAVKAMLVTFFDFAEHDECNSGLCSSIFTKSATPLSTVGGASVAIRKTRYRWTVPTSWEGSYFKITWDVGFFPDEGDPAPVEKDKTWEWTGPGDAEDEATWRSAWYDLAIPDEPGEMLICNTRFECYQTTPFGQKPQVGDDGYDWDDPPPADDGLDDGVQGSTGLQGSSGVQGSTGLKRSKGLRTGGLKTGSLKTGSLRTGSLRSSSLKTGSLRIGRL